MKFKSVPEFTSWGPVEINITFEDREEMAAVVNALTFYSTNGSAQKAYTELRDFVRTKYNAASK